MLYPVPLLIGSLPPPTVEAEPRSEDGDNADADGDPGAISVGASACAQWLRAVSRSETTERSTRSMTLAIVAAEALRNGEFSTLN